MASNKVLGLVLGVIAAMGGAANSEMLELFLHGVNTSALSATLSLNPATAELGLEVTHLRLIPFEFPKPMRYHFDGLAAVMRFKFDPIAKTLTIDAKPYASEAQTHWNECIFEGSGTGPTLGVRFCLTNPVVNMLPINGQLWLTTDTAEWGRVDIDTLDTVKGAKADVKTVVLNAHPACDNTTRDCYVQHPCGKADNPLTDQACFSKLITTDTNLKTVELGRVTLAQNRLIQHSHEPCVTPNFVVAKIDSFGKTHNAHKGDGGVLGELHQIEDNEWMIMDRRTNATTVMLSNFSFVNNHFTNCYEDPADGAIVADTVATTSDYLSTYFADRLALPINYSNIFFRSMRCRIPTGKLHGTDAEDSAAGAAEIVCRPLLEDAATYWDYPTFNPRFKMNPDYQFFYGISITDPITSRWFDRVIKVSAKTGQIEKYWESPGIFVTEAGFVPLSPDTPGAAEDDGVLISVAYNKTAGRSQLLILDAKGLTLIDSYPLGDQIIPFHAHSISCMPEHGCYTNP